MLIPTPSRANEMNPLVELLKQFCETILFHKNSSILNNICKENIVLYSNLTSEIISGIKSLRAFRANTTATMMPFCAPNYKIVEASTDTLNGGYVVLNASQSSEHTFNVIGTITKENNKFLISQVSIFYTRISPQEVQNHTEKCESVEEQINTTNIPLGYEELNIQESFFHDSSILVSLYATQKNISLSATLTKKPYKTLATKALRNCRPLVMARMYG